MVSIKDSSSQIVNIENAAIFQTSTSYLYACIFTMFFASHLIIIYRIYTLSFLTVFN